MKNVCLIVLISFFFTQLIAQIQCTKGNCENGYGVCIFPSGSKYAGDFIDGKIHGQGILYFSNGDKYIGNWINQFREGEGRMIFAGGDEYIGEFLQNKFHGEGIMQYASGNRYEGYWTNNQPNGKGTFYYSNGDRYVGQLEKGVCQGQGTMYYSDGARYVGNWFNNKKHGQGMMDFSDGQKIQGEWADDQYLADWSEFAFAGDTASLQNCNEVYCSATCGKYTYKDGSQYVGDFHLGQPSGIGTVYYVSGDRYEGGWENHTPDGKGIMYYANGKVLGALWDHGKPVQKLFAENEGLAGEPVIIEKDAAVKIWAVIVGAARYNHMPTLRYTDDDAYQVYAFLKSPEGGALPDSQVKLLIDEDATRKQMLDAMRSIFLKADENDVVLFYFSGHGLKGSFLPYDYDGYNNRVLHEEITNLLDLSRAKHKLVIADACHSGSLLAQRNAFQSSLNKYYEAFELTKGGTALLMSSKGEEFSLEDGGLRSGIFSHFLVRGLKGAANANDDKIITISELYNYVYQKVRAYTGNVQTPALTGDYDADLPVAIIR